MAKWRDNATFEVDRRYATYRPWANNRLKLYNDGCADKDGNGALAEMLAAIRQAQHFIFICDWSFHPEFRIEPKGEPIGRILAQRSLESKDLLIAVHTWNHTNAASEDQQNDHADAILRSFLSELITQKNSGSTRRPPLPGEVGWKPSNLLWRMSSRTEIGWSHHQKFVVLDTPGPGSKRMITVFFGGLDLTKGRYDWGTHCNVPDDESVDWMVKPFEDHFERYDEWYNAEFDTFGRDASRLTLPRQTWHDVEARLTGPLAWDFVREFVARWSPSSAWLAGDTKPWSNSNNGSLYLRRPVVEKFDQLLNPARFVQQDDEYAYRMHKDSKTYPPGLYQCQLTHSMDRNHWAAPDLGDEATADKGAGRQFSWLKDFQWSVQNPKYEASILESYRNFICQAQQFIYIENQYFIGSGERWASGPDLILQRIQNDIPELLVESILRRVGSDFHVYIVVPLFPEGIPNDFISAGVRYNQWRTIEYMIKTLYNSTRGGRILGEDWTRYLSFYFLGQWDKDGAKPPRVWKDRRQQVQESRRYMIYAHTKLMICDDTSMILGSCNLNERGLAGNRDSEICVSMWPQDETVFDCMKNIRGLREKLWTEHLGVGREPQPLAGSWWKSPGSAECAYQVQLRARRNYDYFRRNTGRNLSGHLCAWPIVYDRDIGEIALHPPRGASYFPATSPQDYEHELIPDHEVGDILKARTLRDMRVTFEKVRLNSWAIRPSASTFPILTE